jgi:hypothetical protein
MCNIVSWVLCDNLKNLSLASVIISDHMNSNTNNSVMQYFPQTSYKADADTKQQT